MWPHSRDFPGTWDECFEPIDGLIVLPIHPPMEHADLKAYSVHREADWSILCELRPSEQVRRQLPTGTYDAVHIRRTDHTELVRQFGWAPQHTDEQYDEFIAGSKADYVWVACDNPQTQERMRHLHGDKVRVLREMHDNDDYRYPDGKVRYTDGVWSVVDMFACVGARRFMPSLHSTFSNLVLSLREQCAGMR